MSLLPSAFRFEVFAAMQVAAVMRCHSHLRCAPAILMAVACLSCASLSSAQESFESPLEVRGELSAERPEIPRFEPLPRIEPQPPIEPLPLVEPSDTFSTSPVERSRDLSAIRLSAAPPSGSPAAPNPLRTSRPDDDSVSTGRHDPQFVSWVPPALSHKPVYFEEVGVERYGQTRSQALQPLISGGKFLANAAILPYRMGVDSPHRISYDVGLARPGSPTPGVREALPFSLKGMLYQGAATTSAGFFLRP